LRAQLASSRVGKPRRSRFVARGALYLAREFAVERDGKA